MKAKKITAHRQGGTSKAGQARGKRSRTKETLAKKLKRRKQILAVPEWYPLYLDLIQELINASQAFTQAAVVSFSERQQKFEAPIVEELKRHLKKHYPKYWKSIEAIRAADGRLIIER